MPTVLIGRPEPEQPNFDSRVILDKVVNQCVCGYEWEEKESEQINEEV